MLNFSEKVNLVNEYTNWLDEKNKKLITCKFSASSPPINVITFLIEKGILDEYDIHDYFKAKGD